jgi:Flp pilus assembly protein TadG
MKTKRQAPGQSMVEFGLILPIILLIIIIFIDLGRIVYYYSALNNAVREGARYGIVTSFASSTARQTEIRNKVAHYAVALPLDVSKVSIYCDRVEGNTPNPCTDYVTVKAVIELPPIIPYFAQLIGAGSTYKIRSISTMQMTPYGRYVP